ncbi:MAG: type VI secretion system tip protein VgrG [Bacteroidetes bacterium]|nr:type VI secretion system tip protein VgrG [Bacteroidota bacterium]
MPAKSPANLTDTTLSVAVSVNGSPIKDTYPILSINITLGVNKISHAELVFIDGDIETGKFPLSDSDDFIPGNEIEIKAGYVTDGVVSIFKGYIVKQAVEIDQASGYTTVVTCKHKAVTMTFSKKEAQFSKVTDSDIISKVVKTYGLSCTVKSTSVTQEAVFQKLATDWDFMLSRAELYGYIVTLDGDAITIGEPKISGAAVLKIAQGDAIRSFKAEVSAERQATALNATAWDIKNQALLKAPATEPSVNSQGNLTGKDLSGKLSQSALSINSCTPMVMEELQAWADANLLRMRLSALKGEVSFIGNASVKPGTIIELDGVGDRYNGSAFVTSVNHVIEQGQWTTYVKFGLDSGIAADKPNFSYTAAAGQLPAIQGLQVATVKKLFDDPDSQFRILVNLVSNADDQDGIWARLSGFYASSGFGSVFTPEVGDEVVIGFLESNPRYPIVLGSLYSNGRANPYPPKDDNNYIKSLTTKTKLKIGFDDEKKVITIETPGGNSITFSDDDKSILIKDQNSNTVKMSSSGIEMKSGKDISLEATADVNIKATGKINLTAQQDVAVSGLNISNTANMGFTAKGNATAEVSASGQTTVKGGIVMIN